ncbi:MAG TPA: glutathione S-transferase family protein [Solirubrobacterales bacterium]|jgi:glutathione S-transferase
MTAPDQSRPLLWQLAISHYSEKVRWALDYKRVPHRRRSTLAGIHIAVALYLTRGATVTFPILELGGATIADSTAAIAALERRHPERPLYPEDPGERRRALALEHHFDEGLGPAARLLPFHELGREPEMFGELAALAVPPPLSRAPTLLASYARVYTRRRFGVAGEAAAARARAAIVAALERIEIELASGDGMHLVGERFSVADLTAASLAFPVVMPEGGPLPADIRLPSELERFRAELRERPGYRWVEETYARYRRAPVPAAAA